MNLGIDNIVANFQLFSYRSIYLFICLFLQNSAGGQPGSGSPWTLFEDQVCSSFEISNFILWLF